MSEDTHEQALVNVPESNLPYLSIIELIIFDREMRTGEQNLGQRERNTVLGAVGLVFRRIELKIQNRGLRLRRSLGKNVAVPSRLGDERRDDNERRPSDPAAAGGFPQEGLNNRLNLRFRYVPAHEARGQRNRKEMAPRMIEKDWIAT